jgi:TonB family protein
MSDRQEPRLLLEWEGEEARWRRLSSFLLAVFIQIVGAILILLAPNFLGFLSPRAALVKEEEAPKQQLTFLYYPKGLPQKLRQPPITNKLSDQNRIAQGRSPVVNPNGIRAPYIRGNSKLPDVRGGGKQKPSPPPAPPPAPQRQAAKQPAEKQPSPPKEEPKQEAKLRLLNVPSNPSSSAPRIHLPTSTPGQAIQQSLEAAVQNRNSGQAIGPGDSANEFQNLNPNFSTSGPIILSDTRGVNFGPYLARVVYVVRRNWYAVIPESARLGEKGRVALVFEIVKDGSVPQLRLVASSGSEALDRAALASIKASNPFPPLPQEFTGKHLILEFIYLYNLGTNGY